MVGQRHDLHIRRGVHRLGVQGREVEGDGLLSADDAVSTPVEVLLRLDVALDDLAFQLRPAGLRGSAPEIREQRRADAAPPYGGDDNEMRPREIVRPRIDEAAAPAGSPPSRATT
jgi:hypothetical protein